MGDKTDDLIAAGMAALKAQESIPPGERFDRMVAAGLITADGKVNYAEGGSDEEVPISQLIQEVAPPKELLTELSAEAFLKMLDLIEHPPEPGRGLKDAVARYRTMVERTTERTIGEVLDKAAGSTDPSRDAIDHAKYIWWLRERIISDPAILGGSPVFVGSRLSVNHVGGVALRGEEAVAHLLDDYPDLTRTDVSCARRWVQMRRIFEWSEMLGFETMLRVNYTKEDLAELIELDRMAQAGELAGQGTSLEAMMALLLRRGGAPSEVDHDQLARRLRSGRAGAPKGGQSPTEVDHEKLREVLGSHTPDPGFADAVELAAGESGAQAAALAVLSAFTPDQLSIVESWMAGDQDQTRNLAEVRRHFTLWHKLAPEAT